MNDQEINRYWKRIIDTMNDGLMLIGLDGSIIMVNKSFERLTGYTADEVIGRPCTLLNCDGCESAMIDGGGSWCRLFEKGEVIKQPCHLITKDGACLHILKNASLLKNENGVTLGAVETLTDKPWVETKLARIQSGLKAIAENPQTQNKYRELADDLDALIDFLSPKRI